ncbi:hypothetical protein GCM10020000_03730 [Streptomyces olivoverticillatus]
MDTPVAASGPSAWQGATLEERDWLVPLHPPLLARAPGSATGDAPSGRDSADPVARAAQCLSHGPGLAVVRGLGLDTLTDEECVEACRRFMAPLGDVRPVNPDHPGDNLVTAAAPPPPHPRHVRTAPTETSPCTPTGRNSPDLHGCWACCASARRATAANRCW